MDKSKWQSRGTRKGKDFPKIPPSWGIPDEEQRSEDDVYTYRDFAKTPEEEIRVTEEADKEAEELKGALVQSALLAAEHHEKECILPAKPMVRASLSVRAQRFPVKLYAILAQPELDGIISWMPHGRAWKVHNSGVFESFVLPVFFDSDNYHSFNRVINAWGFRRISAGADRGAYFHELFLRGKPHLQQYMRRMPKSTRKSLMDKQHEPDFFELEKTSPLPSLASADAAEEQKRKTREQERKRLRKEEKRRLEELARENKKAEDGRKCAVVRQEKDHLALLSEQAEAKEQKTETKQGVNAESEAAHIIAAVNIEMLNNQKPMATMAAIPYPYTMMADPYRAAAEMHAASAGPSAVYSAFATHFPDNPHSFPPSHYPHLAYQPPPYQPLPQLHPFQPHSMDILPPYTTSSSTAAAPPPGPTAGAIQYHQSPLIPAMAASSPYPGFAGARQMHVPPGAIPIVVQPGPLYYSSMSSPYAQLPFPHYGTPPAPGQLAYPTHAPQTSHVIAMNPTDTAATIPAAAVTQYPTYQPPVDRPAT